jgi:putative transposase
MNENVLPIYQDKHIYMILDNSKIHHAHALDEFKEINKDKITFIFLPPYSPKLNRIEGLWKWLKETVIYNDFFKNVFGIKMAVIKFLHSIKYEAAKIKKRLCF